MQISPATLLALQQGFSARFNMAFQSVKPTWMQVAMEVPSSASIETYGWMKDLPGMREWVGARVIHNIEATLAQVKNKTFEHTIGVNVDDIADDKLGIYGTRFAMQGEVAARHPDDLVWGGLLAGFTTKGFDGKVFFAADHETFDEKGKAKAWSNVQAGSGAPWFLLDLSRSYMKPMIFQKRQDVQQTAMVDPNNPHVFMNNEYLYGIKARYAAALGFHQLAVGSKAELNATNYEAARLALAAQRRPDGSPLGVGGAGVALVYGATNEGKARTLILKQNLAAGEDNIWFNSADLVKSPWLP